MKTVVKLDYATFAFEQGSISIPKIEDALAQCDLHFAQTSNASENSPYNSPSGLFYKPNNGAKQSPHSLQVSGHGCDLFRSTLPRLASLMQEGHVFGHFSRLDFCFDVVMTKQRWREFYLGVISASVDEMNNPEKARKVRKFMYQGYGDSTTVYIGRRMSSAVFCRIYNKSLQDPEKKLCVASGEFLECPDDSYIIRYELELKYTSRVNSSGRTVYDPSPLFWFYYEDPEKLFAYLRKVWNRYGNDTLLPDGWEEMEFITDIVARGLHFSKDLKHPLCDDLANKFSVSIHTEEQKMSYVLNTFGHRVIDILLYRPELLFLACCKWEQFYNERLPFSPLALTQEIAQFSESSRIAVEEFAEVVDDPSPFSEVGFDDISLF